MTKLPIDEILPQFLEAFSEHSAVIVHAPPGAGKTTRLPLAIMNALLPGSGRIVVLQPRKVAAVSAASWVASSINEKVGSTIGYVIRFDSCISAATRIEFVTEGVLTRRLQNDPFLGGVDVVIFDEFHERSIHADLGLALCREVQQIRPELKIVLMSATLDLQPLSRLLDNAPVISSEGRCHPVEIRYLGDTGAGGLPVKVVATVRKALAETEGDILAFLPGSGEIHTSARLLAEDAELNSGTAVCKLYGDMPLAEQQKVFKKSDKRKIVLATSIAETSLTIDGIRTVIDSGLSRRIQYDQANALNRLVTVRESRASADQRAGRAGRTSSGVCYRMYSRHTLQAMTPNSPPEIAVSDLTQLVLELAAWGVKEPLQLDWLTPPSLLQTDSARRVLEEIELIDRAGRITKLGEEAAKLPLHPRLARILLKGKELGCLELACAVAALLSERDLFKRGTRIAVSRCRSDIEERLEAVRSSQMGGAVDERLDGVALKLFERLFGQLLQMSGGANDRNFSDYDHDLTVRLLLAGYPDRVAMRRASGEDRYLLSSGQGAILSSASGVRGVEFLIAPLLLNNDGAESAIYVASELSVEMLREECKERIEIKRRVEWDESEGRVTALKTECLGSLVITSEATRPDEAEAVIAVLGALRASSLQLLRVDETASQLRCRLALLKKVFPEDGWPDLSDAALLQTLEDWLAPYLKGVTTARKIAELDIAGIIKQSLDYRQRMELEELAPTHIVVPSGSRIKINYTGETPLLSVKLQELFGLAKGPEVCKGAVPLLLQLLSPAGRALQITGDLSGFWNGSYHDVKKELKGRYPKHPWPDDPWSAQPTRFTKRSSIDSKISGSDKKN